MSELSGAGSSSPVESNPRGRAPEGEAAVELVIEQAGRQLRAPWAASIAGLLFAILFTLALLLMRSSPLVNADDAELARMFAAGRTCRSWWAGSTWRRSPASRSCGLSR